MQQVRALEENVFDIPNMLAILIEHVKKIWPNCESGAMPGRWCHPTLQYTDNVMHGMRHDLEIKEDADLTNVILIFQQGAWKTWNKAMKYTSTCAKSKT